MEQFFLTLDDDGDTKIAVDISMLVPNVATDLGYFFEKCIDFFIVKRFRTRLNSLVLAHEMYSAKDRAVTHLAAKHLRIQDNLLLGDRAAETVKAVLPNLVIFINLHHFCSQQWLKKWR